MNAVKGVQEKRRWASVSRKVRSADFFVFVFEFVFEFIFVFVSVFVFVFEFVFEFIFVFVSVFVFVFVSVFIFEGRSEGGGITSPSESNLSSDENY